MVAIFYLLFSVIVWSFLPLVGAVVLEKIDQWHFMLWSQLVGLVTTWILLRINALKTGCAYLKFTQLDKKSHIEFAFSGLCLMLSMACMWKSFSYISKAGATVVYEVWPIFSMFLTPICIKKGWGKLPARDYVYAILAFAGVAFILLPELHQHFFLEHSGGIKPFFILLLPFFGGVFMALSSVFKARLSYNIGVKDKTLVSMLMVQTYCIFYGMLFITAFVGLQALSGAITTNTYDWTSIGLIVIAGVVINALGSLAYVIGLLKSRKPNIIALWYFMPVFSVIWLFMAGLATITPNIIIGTAAIICSNLLITIRADEHVSYSATILSLLAVGVLCFFSHGLEMQDYYQAMSIPLMFYAIVVSFLMDRLIKRDTFEEGLALDIIQHIQTNIVLNSSALIERILAMMHTGEAIKISQHYKHLRNDTKDMQPVQHKLDALVLSRIEGVNFSEIFILSLIGMLTIMMTVVYRPNIFVADCFAIVLTTAIVFAFFMVIDLVKKRKVFNLMADEQGRFSLTKNVLEDASDEGALATAMIVLVIAAFTLLMWVKHSG